MPMLLKLQNLTFYPTYYIVLRLRYLIFHLPFSYYFLRFFPNDSNADFLKIQRGDLTYFSMLWICFSSLRLSVSQKVELTAKKLSCIECFKGKLCNLFSCLYATYIGFHFESIFVIQSYNPSYRFPFSPFFSIELYVMFSCPFHSSFFFFPPS